LFEAFDAASVQRRDFSQAAAIARQLVPLDASRPWWLHAAVAEFRGHPAETAQFVEAIGRISTQDEAALVAGYWPLLDKRAQSELWATLVKALRERPAARGLGLALVSVAKSTGEAATALAYAEELAATSGEPSDLGQLADLLRAGGKKDRLKDVLRRLGDVDAGHRPADRLAELELLVLPRDSERITELRRELDGTLHRAGSSPLDRAFLESRYAAALRRFGATEAAMQHFAAIANENGLPFVLRQASAIQAIELDPSPCREDVAVIAGIAEAPASPTVRQDAAALLDRFTRTRNSPASP
jgi:hypothetical protein